ncbi:unnamed protein product, partial [Closterium sp. Yama58-4]
KSNGSHAIQNLHGELSAAQASVRALQSTVEVMQQQMRKSSSESASLLEELTELKALRLTEVTQHKDQVAHLQSTLTSLRHALDKERDTNTRLLRTLQEAEKAALEVATDAQGMSTHAHKLMRLAAGHRDRLGKAAAAAAAVSATAAAAAAAAAGAGGGK